jgi:hypothetical protein
MTRKSAKVAKALAKRDAAKTRRKAVPNPTEQPKAPLRRQPADREGYGDAPVQAYIGAMPSWMLRTVCAHFTG